MRKILPVLTFMVCLLVPALAFSMEATVEITGPQELTSLKSGIEKSVITRCIAKGIALEKYQKITISLSKLGDIISYDALLDTKPARAFHKDLKDTSALSATIDEMIDAIFPEAVKLQVAEPQISKAPTGQESAPKIMLPFIATSIAAIGDRIYVSDAKTVYELKSEKTYPLWKAPGNNEILRIYPYGESIIVLAKLMNDCTTFMISGKETKERWGKAVIPLGNGLVSTNLTFNRIYGTIPYLWSKATQVAGSSPQIPDGLDVISSLSSEGITSSTDTRIITYNPKGTMVVSNGKSIIWADDTNAGNAPQFIEDLPVDRSYTGGDPVIRYYLKPRMVMLGSKIITFRNSQGTTRIVSGLNLFEYSQVLVYTQTGDDFTKNELATFPDSYCPDIIVIQGKIAALLVKNKVSFVQFLGL
jgi:hypothetical protein